VTERLLTTRQLAEFLGVSPETVLRRWRAGKLPGYRLASNVLRFRESEIEAWLEGTRPERSVAEVRPRSTLGDVWIAPAHPPSTVRDCAWPPGARGNRVARGPSR